MKGRIVSVSLSDAYTFEKTPVTRARLLAGLGLEGDIHSGKTVKHRSRVAADPTQPNLRQVHLIPSELFRELAEAGYDVAPGRLGENIQTEGLDLLALPAGTRLDLGPEAAIELTGLRNPCVQLDGVGPGLMKRLAYRNEKGQLVRRAGVMGIVLVAGEIAPNDPIEVTLPPEPHVPMDRV